MDVNTNFAVNVTILKYFGKFNCFIVIISTLTQLFYRFICNTIYSKLCRPQGTRHHSYREQEISALPLTQSSKRNNRLLSRCYSSQCTEEEQSRKCLPCDSPQIFWLCCGAELSPSSSFFGPISSTTTAVAALLLFPLCILTLTST